MDTVKEAGTETGRGVGTLPLPSTNNEYITTIAHYHRAEIARMAGWRDRIDRTTNWAITVVAALLSVSLSTPSANHGVLLFGMLLVMLLLWIEARRYRFFDVYRARVRQVERNYFAAILAPGPAVDPQWARHLGEDLREPQFVLSHQTAMARRLSRNYIWMFLILLLAWVLKISSTKLQHEGVRQDFAQSLRDVVANSALGPVPGWLVIVAVAVFYAWLLYATFRHRTMVGEMSYGSVHV